MPSLLTARGLVIGRRGRALSEPFDVDLEAGGILAVLGPNGSGKSTLFGTLLGLIAPLCGSVLWSGAPVSTLSSRQRSDRFAWVPQSDPIVFDLDLPAYVMLGRLGRLALGCAPGSADRACVREAIERVGLGSLTGRTVARMSGGERRLASIARALVQQAGAILLDEPLAGLDLANQERILERIVRLAADGVAIAFSTQDPNHASIAGTGALLIQPGGRVLTGRVEQVLSAENLSRAYGTAIQESVSPDGRTWLVPGRSAIHRMKPDF